MELLVIIGIFIVFGIIIYVLESVKPGSTDEYFKRWEENKELERKVREIERIKREYERNRRK